MTRVRMTRYPSRKRPALETLTTLQIAALGLCRFSQGGSCTCYDLIDKPPACNTVREAAAKLVADIRTYDGRQKELKT